MKVPKPRPPSPHSSRLSILSARRQRAAAKPRTVTTRNRKTKTLTATAFTAGPPAAPGVRVWPRASRSLRSAIRDSANAMTVSTVANGISAIWNQ